MYARSVTSGAAAACVEPITVAIERVLDVGGADCDAVVDSKSVKGIIPGGAFHFDQLDILNVIVVA